MISGTKEAEIVEWIASQKNAMIELLRDVVDLDSGSYDKAGVDAVGARFERHFAVYGIETWREPHDVYGDAVHAVVKKPGSNEKPILLMGHRDTVFPAGEAGRRPFRVEGGRAYGPGVADMKSGLVINVFLLAAFHATGGHPGPLATLITADEEIGSPSSRPVIEAAAREARVVLNGEPGRASGNVVSGRKGGAFLRFAVHGRAAHSGGNFAEGRSAIGELAHKVVALHVMTDLARGVTVNVGIVAGGNTVNTVAPLASGEIDLRYVRAEDRDWALDRVAAIMASSTVPDTVSEWSIASEFLPLAMTPASQRLLELYTDVSARMGVSVAGEFTGGCADSGFAAAQGTPTLCGLGAVGGKAHTVDEYMELPSLLQRAQALAGLIMRLPETGL